LGRGALESRLAGRCCEAKSEGPGRVASDHRDDNTAKSERGSTHCGYVWCRPHCRKKSFERRHGNVDHRTSLSIVSSLPRSNGVGLSPDEKTLYLNANTRTVKYPLAIDGTVGMGTDLGTGLNGADGIAIDCAGNVFIAQNNGGSVVVVSAGGTRLGELGGLPRIVTNAAFGG
jgi:sugar lactone lactonase YvrE